MNANAKQIRTVYGYLTAYGLLEKKEEIVKHICGGRTSSLRELEAVELEMILTLIQTQVKENFSIYARFDFNNKQHKYILSLAHQLGWEASNGYVCLQRLGAWIKKYGHLHKPLKFYNTVELQKLIIQLENTVYSYVKKDQYSF